MPIGIYSRFGGGGNNPCGAYYPVGGPEPLTSAGRLPSDGCVPTNYDTNTLGQSNWDPESTTRGHGLCCDIFKRVNPSVQGYAWDTNKQYKVFDTVAATGEACPGCFYHSRANHTSFAASSAEWSNVKPCEVKPAYPYAGTLYTLDHVTNYVQRWSSCKALISEGMPGKCTMHNSFGIITESTVNVSHAGSPNGSCQSNCMQLDISYFQKRVAGAYLSYAQYPPNNFDNTTAYDCELKQTDFQGNSGPTGPKLIWAGFAPNQWQQASDSTPPSVFAYSFFGTLISISSLTPTNPVPGYTQPITLNWDENLGNNPQNVTYKMNDILNGTQYQGYLAEDASPGNSWGLLDSSSGVGGSTPPQEDSHLWARKSVWRIMPAGSQSSPTTSKEDAFACCTYVSFGCTDPNFGSYDPNAFLDCNGVPKTNKPDQNGNCLNINNNPSPYPCFENQLDCSQCIDPNTGDYYLTPPLPPSNCTQEILDACGSTGKLSPTAWTDMHNAKPTSHFYGGGASNLDLQGPNHGLARFWSKDGTVLNDNEADRPLCQCKNSGCMLPGADNYSALNTKDCVDETPQTSPYGDVTCCTFQEFGCPDSNFSTDPQNNYFCTIDINNDGTPDNIDLCIDSNGIPCTDPTSICTNENGGQPSTSTLGTNNFNVNLIDDGSCELTTIPGCRDDGGNLAGGTWPSPVYPGYSAINFDSTATIHIQSLCVYAFGCPDPLAQNVINGSPVCPTDQFTGTIDNVINNYPTLGLTPEFVESNLIPNIQCCDYNIQGTGPGCTDPNALNYNPLANQDDGSCVYSVEGCTDPNALNFNPSATLDDSSCVYPGDYPSEGDNFLDGSPIEICREPLTKEEVLMNVCQPTEIQSEVFIERGKQSVFEPNQRLDEVKTIGGLKIYGYGFYNIKEQI